MVIRKVNVNVRIPTGLKKWLDDLADEGLYGNTSDIIRLAILEFKNKLEKEKHEEVRRKDRMIEILFQEPELQKEIIEALKKRQGEGNGVS